MQNPQIFLDGGDPSETKLAKALYEELAGQTTNPSLIAKNKAVAERVAKGERFTEAELTTFYKTVVLEIAEIIPDGSVSIEVYADESTTAEAMLGEAREKATWVRNAFIKYPITPEGLKAAEQSVKEGIRVNMTLCFSQEQAAAVYAATRGASPGSVYVSPFIGRLDDQGKSGLDLIRNISDMYKRGDGHVNILAASVRNVAHIKGSIQNGTDIVTAPYAALKEWAIHQGESAREASPLGLAEIPYTEVSLEKDWQTYDIVHPLTTAGLKKFVDDWKSLF